MDYPVLHTHESESDKDSSAHQSSEQAENYEILTENELTTPAESHQINNDLIADSEILPYQVELIKDEPLDN
jgi:hypothetical protein